MNNDQHITLQLYIYKKNSTIMHDKKYNNINLVSVDNNYNF